MGKRPHPSYHDIRRAAAEACHAIADAGLVLLAFGNASAVDRERGVFAIKPSGIPCSRVTPDQCVVVAIEDGHVVDGVLRPSSDEPTHRLLYQRFAQIGGVVHTHSPEATAWAQACRAIPCLGTTHADHFRGDVPVTRELTDQETGADYEWATGLAIIERFEEGDVDPWAVPAILVRSHGPFAWGHTAADAAANAEAIEGVARLARLTRSLAPDVPAVSRSLAQRHFERKHGPGAYYGQEGTDLGRRVASSTHRDQG